VEGRRVPAWADSVPFAVQLKSMVLGLRPALLLVSVSLFSACALFAQSIPAPESQELADLRKAADAGDARKQYALGNKYYFGTGVPKDHDEGMRWLRRAAEHGDAEIQRGVGFIYWLDGNERETIYWYQKSAAQGNFLATSNLFSYCLKGTITQKDCSDVANWLRAFAAKDDAQGAEARCHLGSMSEKGIGVYQNYPEAAQWYRKCASPGNWQGQMSLGDLYIEGKGVPKDLVLAYMWLNLAAATAPQNDLVSMGNNIAKQRDALATMMTPEQIAEAQRLSREWKPGKE